MATNDLILLDKILADLQEQSIKKVSVGEYFENFCNEQILKNYDLSLEEIEAGMTDGANDGGIDSVYIFINGCLFSDIDNFPFPKSESTLEVLIITSKHESTFQQATINSELTSISELLDLKLDDTELVNPYNDRILEKRELFKRAYLELATKLRSFKIRFIYVSRGDTDCVGENVKSKSEQLIKTTQSLFSGCEVTYNFLGASEILDLYRKKKEFNLCLPFEEQLADDGQKYIILCNIRDYYKFLINEDGDLRRYLFDSNVRDFVGFNKVNSDIYNSLTTFKDIDFWWLNNGITILSSNAINLGKSLKIENVQIVNGLQTSNTIFEYFRKYPNEVDTRKIMVKIITETDSSIRDQIIRATNNQTMIQESSLHATDKIQRDIEDILLKHNLYYDRRTNFYANQGIDSSLIFSPLYIAAGYVSIIEKNIREAIVLKQKVMQKPEVYKSIYIDTPLDYWPKVAKLLRNTDLYITKKRLENHYKSSEGYLKTLRHIVAFIAISAYFNKYDYTHKDIKTLSISQVEDIPIDKIYDFLVSSYPYYDKQTWKSQEFINEVIIEASKQFNINNPDAVIKKRNKKYSFTSKNKNVNVKIEDLELILKELPKQPWPVGVHKAIAQRLKMRPWYVSAAISQLIDKGIFYTQVDGILYDKSGNVVS